jgi:hypothetical protein
MEQTDNQTPSDSQSPNPRIKRLEQSTTTIGKITPDFIPTLETCKKKNLNDRVIDLENRVTTLETARRPIPIAKLQSKSLNAGFLLKVILAIVGLYIVFLIYQVVFLGYTIGFPH